MFDSQNSIILAQALLAFGFAIFGGAVSVVMTLGHRSMCALITLAAGTLFGVTVFIILPESLETSGFFAVLLAAGSGYGLFYLISKYVHHVCPACAASHFEEETTHRFGQIAVALLVALSIHSTSDGIAISAGHESTATHLNEVFNWSLLLALCVHKVPEGLALGGVLLGASFSRIATVCWVATVEFTTVIGAILGIIFFSDISPFWLGLVLAHIGGGFLYLAAHALLGEMIRHEKKSVILNFTCGVILISAVHVGLTFFLP